ncbi:tetratricopeptide repeat protein [Methanosarcina sp. T3]|uniref:tetratricopeptide repeat protein n=1 Tax=Methanosarcina sp. T3 TaxID=3439062 RepID=UPI003F840DFD
MKRLGMFRQAEAMYREALELDPENINIRYNYSLFLFKLERFNEAKEQYIKAMSSDSSLILF